MRAWPALPAVARDNLFVVDANLLHRAGPLTPEQFEQLKRMGASVGLLDAAGNVLNDETIAVLQRQALVNAAATARAMSRIWSGGSSCSNRGRR